MKEQKNYYLNREGEFVIEDYNRSPYFSSFFPGIAGLFGIPMWVFYVNRAQGIACLGVKDKNNPILEFVPADRAYRQVYFKGFRTFFRVKKQGKEFFYEPFQDSPHNQQLKVQQKMAFTADKLRLEETNPTLGLQTKIEYFTLANEPLACLVRVLRLKNISRTKLAVSFLDGLPTIVPTGISDLFLKYLSRTIEAWMMVENSEKNLPFYHAKANPQDVAEVIPVSGGNFYFGYAQDTNSQDFLKVIVDPEVIFGERGQLWPHYFFQGKKFVLPKKQICEGRSPCAFSYADISLKPAQEMAFYFFIGRSHSLTEAEEFSQKARKEDFVYLKAQENRALINSLMSCAFTASENREFNLYCQQNFLDNLLRGGYPLLIKNGKESLIFYVYSRKHGDLERDYNNFLLNDTYLSQGNGNFRDMNQNRRLGTWFNPQIKEYNLVNFFNLIQADGFNPLVIKGLSFRVEDLQKAKDALEDLVTEAKAVEGLLGFLRKPFAPGELLRYLKEHKIKLKISLNEFLKICLGLAEKNKEAEHGEGFWVDHWRYNLDLLEQFLAIYPEKLREILIEKKLFSFYDNAAIVKPRSEKYVLKNNRVFQLYSVVFDPAKKEMLRRRSHDVQPFKVRSENGKGAVYYTHLLAKLLCLLANKLASFDPFGVGIEMDAEKPGWDDALNGLPALFGSSTCETFELKRLVNFLRDSLGTLKLENDESIFLYEELYDFLNQIKHCLKENLSAEEKNQDFLFWDKANLAKELYRQKTKFGFSGKEKPMAVFELKEILEKAEEKIALALEKSWDRKTGLPLTYFIHEAVDYEVSEEKDAQGKVVPKQSQEGYPCVKVKSFRQKPLPLFLEGVVAALKLAQDEKKARQIYQATKRSGLYDSKLAMYKINAPLKGTQQEIGRLSAFTPGWLENESIWLHMQYKYLLEVLKSGLAVEFFSDLKRCLICFQDAQIYGRSILENSSFLVSSAHPDEKLHGRGFVARLSGATSEFLNFWLIMNLGKHPFIVDGAGKLCLRLKPILPGWLFTKEEKSVRYFSREGEIKEILLAEGTYAFMFLSQTLIVYHNPSRKDTFGVKGAKVHQIILDDGKNKLDFSGHIISFPFAEKVREGKFRRIDVYLE
jgi:hypothetical protein